MPKRRSLPALRGTYEPPKLRLGQLTDCLVRDETLVVSSWSEAPISWPRGCRPVQSPGSPSLIVDEELARAVREESAAAIRYWWGVSNRTVCKWRKALGVDRRNNEGSQALIHAATTRARSAQAPVRSEEYRQKQRENIRRRRAEGSAPELATGRAWSPEHKALLGTMPDEEVASRTGHPLRSVKTVRLRLRIPRFQNEARTNGRPTGQAPEAHKRG
jgi:hypothetical protein